MSESSPEHALADIADHLRSLGVPFALVGGLAVSLRAEVRFTRDVDLAVSVADDAALEKLVYALRGSGYVAVALVRHEVMNRIATARLASPSGVIVDLLAASSGIEAETVARATLVSIEGLGAIAVARPEELLALKVLSMSERRLQDRIDAESLLVVNEPMSIDVVRANLKLISDRGFDRHQDLVAKLELLLRRDES